MTELELQNEIKEVLQNEILNHISIFEDKEVKVLMQSLPYTTEYEDDTDRYYPCCIVHLHGGEVKNPNDAQITVVEITIGIKDESEDMTGYQSVAVILQRIRDYFLKHGGIPGKFRLLYPIEWALNTEDFQAPYFAGSIITQWVTDVMPYYDEFL